MSADVLQDRMRALRDAFVEALAKDLPALIAAIEREEYEVASAYVHKIAGRAGTFGFPEVSDRASDLEALLAGQVDPDRVHAATTALDDVGRRAMASAAA